MKYLGSKRRIVNHILPIILKNKEEYDLYIEPFCGSLAVIDNVYNFPKLACDINPYLIAMWKGLQFLNTEIPKSISKELYDEQRNKFNILKKINRIHICEIVNNVEYATVYDKKPLYFENNTVIEMSFNDIFLIGWVGFMGSFNGRFYDGGYSGRTDKRDYVDEQIRNTWKQVPYLVLYNDFITFSFEELVYFIKNKKHYRWINKYEKPFLIYCDPPYKNVKNYTYGIDYENFYNQLRTLSNLGHKVFISEYEMPDDFKCVWEMQVTNSMHTKNTKKPIEKLFTL
jgi:DNA adenine methylase